MKYIKILFLFFVAFTNMRLAAMAPQIIASPSMVDAYILYAVQNGDTQTVLLFDVLIQKCDIYDSNGNNLFEVAVYHRQYIAARLLTAIKPKLNEQKPQGITLYDLIRPS